MRTIPLIPRKTDPTRNASDNNRIRDTSKLSISCARSILLVTNGKFVSLATPAAISTSNPFFVLNPLPTEVPPCT